MNAMYFDTSKQKQQLQEQSAALSKFTTFAEEVENMIETNILDLHMYKIKNRKEEYGDHNLNKEEKQ